MIEIVIAGFLAGIISGMGIGGGTLLIPALLFFTDLTQQQAQGVNLLFFLPTALIALYTHIKNKNVEIQTAKPLIWTGLLGALCGSLLAVFLQPQILRKVFAGFLFIMGLTEVFHKKKTSKKEDAHGV